MIFRSLRGLFKNVYGIRLLHCNEIKVRFEFDSMNADCLSPLVFLLGVQWVNLKIVTGVNNKAMNLAPSADSFTFFNICVIVSVCLHFERVVLAVWLIVRVEARDCSLAAIDEFVRDCCLAPITALALSRFLSSWVHLKQIQLYHSF